MVTGTKGKVEEKYILLWGEDIKKHPGFKKFIVGAKGFKKEGLEGQKRGRLLLLHCREGRPEGNVLASKS